MCIGTLFPCNLIMHVLTIYHVKLKQSTALELERFDLRWVLPPLYNLCLLLVVEIHELQNLARLGGRPIKCQGWEGGRGEGGVYYVTGESGFNTSSDIGG